MIRNNQLIANPGKFHLILSEKDGSIANNVAGFEIENRQGAKSPGIQTEKNINPISGSISKQTINFIKKEKINLYGKVYEARHFVILSKRLNKKDSEERRYDVWLDINTNHILKMTYSKYGLWEYKLKQVIYSK